jgi:acyl carrier protein
MESEEHEMKLENAASANDVTVENVIKIIKGFLIKELFVELSENQIGVDDGLQSVVGLDSVGFIELRYLCEQNFSLEIEDADFSPENFSSVGRLATLIVRLHSERGSRTRAI